MCWHCQDTNACDCAFCLIETKGGRKAGPCGFCTARAFNERHRAVIDAHDVGDSRNWMRVAAADGSKGHRVYLPLKGLL